jgi:lipopolysaccharide transport system permease protein
MYLSAVMYPVSVVKEKMADYPIAIGLIEYNPMTTVIETFRNIVLGTGEVSLTKILYLLGVSSIIFLVGLIIFNRTEKSFIDTI